jgi:hypothetical protein
VREKKVKGQHAPYTLESGEKTIHLIILEWMVVHYTSSSQYIKNIVEGKLRKGR